MDGWAGGWREGREGSNEQGERKEDSRNGGRDRVMEGEADGWMDGQVDGGREGRGAMNRGRGGRTAGMEGGIE